jgi:hypothetical protein
MPVCEVKVRSLLNSNSYQLWSPGPHLANSDSLCSSDVSWPTYPASQSHRQANPPTSNTALIVQSLAHAASLSSTILCGCSWDLVGSFAGSRAWIWSFCVDRPSSNPHRSEVLAVLPPSHQLPHKSLSFAPKLVSSATWSTFQSSISPLTYRPKKGTKHPNHQSKERSFLLINKWLTSAAAAAAEKCRAIIVSF